MATNISANSLTRVLREIWSEPGQSRIDISRSTELNKSTVSNIVGLLLERGLVEESHIGKVGPSGGRPPIGLRVRANHGWVMGIELQTEGFTAVGIDLDGRIRFSDNQDIDMRRKNLVEVLVDIATRYRNRGAQDESPLLGLGVGLPGFVDPYRGELRESIPLQVSSPVAVAAPLESALGGQIPVFVDNDANCGCWGELTFGETPHAENMLFVLGERRKHTVAMDDYRIMAFGMGLVLNGIVHRGRDFSAGEFFSMLHSGKTVNQFSISDEEARRFLVDPAVNASIVDELGRHIAFLLNTLNLKKVVIGGPAEVLAEDLAQTLRRYADQNWAYPRPVQFSFAASRTGPLAVAYGAASIIVDHALRPPGAVPTEQNARYGAGLLIPGILL